MAICNEQHRWLIELLAYWEGQLRPAQLMEYWQCSRQHASSLLKQYITEFPLALSYDSENKTYRTTECFVPRMISCRANEYLDWLIGYSPSQNRQLPTQVLQPPLRRITPQLMRPLVQALREGRRVDVDYGSVTSSEHAGRVIVPHHLVKTMNRWHIRAWCEWRQEFRDFVLSRFCGTPELMGKSPINSSQDEAWNRQVTLVLAPDPRLTPEQRMVIEEDYGMKNGRLVLNTRACMVNYQLQGLGIDPRKLEAEPEAQQVVIDNFSDIKPWLF